MASQPNVVSMAATRASRTRQVSVATTPSPATSVSTQAAPPPPPTGGNEVDIASLKTHIRWIERGMIGLAVALLALAGSAWHGYDDLTSQLRDVSVKQEGLSGRLDTLDAKLTGKLDLLGEKLDDESKASSRKR